MDIPYSINAEKYWYNLHSGWLLESVIKTLLVLPSNQVEALSKQGVPTQLADNQFMIDSLATLILFSSGREAGAILWHY